MEKGKQKVDRVIDKGKQAIEKTGAGFEKLGFEK